MVELEKAKALLKAGGHTCVFLTKTGVFTSNERGVKPLLSVLNADMGTLGAHVADKVVGKAAAFLYELMKIDALFAFTVSEPMRASSSPSTAIRAMMFGKCPASALISI